MSEQVTMTDFKRELAAIATLRDELKLKAHLAHAELKTQIDDLERRWLLADEQLQRVKSHVKQDSAVIEQRLVLLFQDLKTGYQNVRRALDSN